MYKNEVNKRAEKLLQTLDQLKASNNDYSKTNLESLNKIISDSVQQCKVSEIPTVRVLYSSKASNNSNLSNLNETLENNINREKQLRAKMRDIDKKLEDVNTEIDISEFKCRVLKAKIKANKEVIASLEQ